MKSFKTKLKSQIKTIFENIYIYRCRKNEIKKFHSYFPQIGCINWDAAINKNGEPIVIEANVFGGGMWIIPEAHGKGLFGDKTGEILRWIKFIKKANYTERRKHLFGNMD